MEVVEGTEADRKGGHIARRRADGQLVLRETAQTPPEDEESFRDYRRWRYYNTNSLWIDLRVLAETLEQRGGVLELPLIVNRKTVDPRDSDSTAGDPARERDGRGDRQLPRARRCCASRARGSCRSRRPTTCWCCAPTSTRSPTSMVGRAGARARRGRCRSSSSTSATTSCSTSSSRAFPPARRRCARRSGWSCTATSRSAADVVVRGAVELSAEEPLELDAGTVLGAVS